MKYEILQDTPDIVKGTVGTLNNDRYVFPTREGYEFKTLVPFPSLARANEIQGNVSELNQLLYF